MCWVAPLVALGRSAYIGSSQSVPRAAVFGWGPVVAEKNGLPRKRWGRDGEKATRGWERVLVVRANRVNSHG